MMLLKSLLAVLLTPNIRKSKERLRGIILNFGRAILFIVFKKEISYYRRVLIYLDLKNILRKRQYCCVYYI